MPCFGTGPTPGTQEYEEWLPGVRRRLDSFTHVVDYYYLKAGIMMPQPATLNNWRGWWGSEIPSDATSPVDPSENVRVLQQILLHLDCDDVDVFQLNDIRNLLSQEQIPQALGYAFVLQYCFVALRNGFRNRPTSAEQWLTCDDPRLMLDNLSGKVSDRKLRLFAVACCRRIPDLLADERSQRAVEVAERYAEGVATVGDLAAAAKHAQELGELRGYYGPVAAWAVVPSADDAARYTAWNAFVDRDDGVENMVQADLLRCISGNPFRPVILAPSWITSTITAIARQMYETRDFSAMPILADALEEVGCGNAHTLAHCRGPGAHVRGCWVIDLLLGKS